MFEGSQHIGPKRTISYLEAAGASDINGSTDFDRTNYYETLPSNQLELALWLESDRMGYLLGMLDRERAAPTSATSSATNAARLPRTHLMVWSRKSSSTSFFPRTIPTTPT